MNTLENSPIVICGGGIPAACACIAAGEACREPIAWIRIDDEWETIEPPYGQASVHGYGRDPGVIESLLLEALASAFPQSSEQDPLISALRHAIAARLEQLPHVHLIRIATSDRLEMGIVDGHAVLQWPDGSTSSDSLIIDASRDGLAIPSGRRSQPRKRAGASAAQGPLLLRQSLESLLHGELPNLVRITPYAGFGQRRDATRASLAGWSGAGAGLATNAPRTTPWIDRFRELDESNPHSLARHRVTIPGTTGRSPEHEAFETTATASSRAILSGAGLRTINYFTGALPPDPWRNRDPGDVLLNRRAQWIPVCRDRLDRISVCLSNPGTDPVEVAASLYAVEHVWEYRLEPATPLATGSLTVPPGEHQWCDWDVALTCEDGLPERGYVRLDLQPNPEVIWHPANAIVPGCLSARDADGRRLSRYGPGLTMSFRISPVQPAYDAANVLDGMDRPHRFTHLWRSAPEAGFPQWLQLAWPRSRTIREIRLAFAGNLVWELNAYPPPWRDPQTPANYRIEVSAEGGWESVLEIAENYQRNQRHAFDPALETDRIRILFNLTNGDPSVAVYSVDVS